MATTVTPRSWPACERWPKHGDATNTNWSSWPPNSPTASRGCSTVPPHQPIGWRRSPMSRRARHGSGSASASCCAPCPRPRTRSTAGHLSYAKVRTLTRIATPDNEADLVPIAQRTPASELARELARWLQTHPRRR